MEETTNKRSRGRDWRRNATPAGIQLVYALEPGARRAHELAGLCMLALRAKTIERRRPSESRGQAGQQQEHREDADADD